MEKNLDSHSENIQIDKQKNKAAWVSFIASFFVLAFKTWAYYQTSSSAVLSDAVESIVNVVTSLIALFVIKYVAMPADEDHPYGHGKAEYFSAAFEGGLIFFASIWIILESVRALIQGSQAHHLQDGIIWVGVATGINLAVGLYLKYIGKQTKSEALLASGAHVLSDVWTTIGVVVGLILVIFTGWKWIDSVMAILVGIQLCFESFKIVKEALSALVDKQDLKTIEELTSSFTKARIEGIIDIHNLRFIRSGRYHHVDAHVVVPEFWNISEAHEMSHLFEDKVNENYTYNGEIAFHLDPCKKAYCKICSLGDCPVRISTFEKERSFDPHMVVKGPQEVK